MNIRLCGDMWERNIKYSWVRWTLKKMFFPFFFFLKKEKQIAICLADFVCACKHRNSLGGGAMSCNEAKTKGLPVTEEP